MSIGKVTPAHAKPSTHKAAKIAVGVVGTAAVASVVAAAMMGKTDKLTLSTAPKAIQAGYGKMGAAIAQGATTAWAKISSTAVNAFEAVRAKFASAPQVIQEAAADVAEAAEAAAQNV